MMGSCLANFICRNNCLLQDKERVRARVAEQEEGGEGGKACVGICYYNKLVALEAKEDLTRHNEVYKQVEIRNRAFRSK